MEFTDVDVYTSVTLVDRTRMGGTEITFDHVPLVFPPGQPKLNVPMFVAEWLYTASQGDKYKVWTKAGDYTHRFGVESPTPRLLAFCGDHIADCSVIELDDTVVEGTDIATTRDPNEKVVVQRITVPRNELTEKQGAGKNAGALLGR